MPVSIASDLIRGNTDTIILGHLLNGDSYGYKINKSILQKTDGLYELKEATLYSAFKRLEESGLISSYWGDEATGARRRYYTVTPAGRQAYFNMKTDWQNAKEIIDLLIEEDAGL
jgi:DNA-binding PadR family transcriptional regulator